MRIFTISDLHLSLGTDKPMDIFKGWDDYTKRIEKNWRAVVSDEDAVIIPGDISWGMKIEETVKDFEFIESLPGRKLLIKGNHDLWWSTSKKIHDFFDKNNFKTIDIIFNNCAVLGKYAVAGTRGWISEGGEDDKKIIIREAGRLEASLKAASDTGLEIIVFLHYPPVYADSVCQEIFGIIKRYGVKRVYYGHIHGRGAVNTVHEYDGVKMRLVSCDCVDFTPVLIG